MEQGNEGDEILFFAFRQIGCYIPADIAKVGQVKAELLVEIISKALNLISNGETKIASNLPANVAIRHRICTDLSLKIKDLGFLGECGYNQLLYPIEHQSRDLLKWIMEKIPRTAEEGTEELVGANAILNRNITLALQSWQKSLWKIPFCQTGKPPRNIYSVRSFTSVGGASNSSGGNNNNNQSDFASLLLNKHSLEKMSDLRIAEIVNRKFGGSAAAAGDEGNETAGGGSGAAAEQQQKAMLQAKILASLQSVSDGSYNATKKAKTGAAGTGGGGEGGEEGSASGEEAGGGAATGGGGTGAAAGNTASNWMNMSFQEMMTTISSGQTGVGGQGGGGGGAAGGGGEIGGGSSGTGEDHRGTRFSHATIFSQEVVDPNTFIGGGGGSTSSIGSSSSSSTAAGGGGAGAAGGTGGGGSGGGEHLDRKAQQELEEAKRSQELLFMKQELATLHEQVDREAIFEGQYLQEIARLEEEVKKLQEATEGLEKECMIRKKALELIPSAQENIAKLQSIVDKSTERLNMLQQEWKKVQTPWLEEIESKERKKQLKIMKMTNMMEDIQKYKELMIPMVHDLREKQDRAQILAEEKAKLPKNLNRALYTHRIMDITASIGKQNKEIEKITSDIREKQKAINANNSTLQRADAIAEELIYGAATNASSNSKDSVMVDTYRRLKLLRMNFEQLINAVTNIGQTEKNARDLETKIDQEQSRVASYNFDRIQADSDAVNKENATLLQQVKGLAAAGGK